MIYVRSKGFEPAWTYEVWILGVWQPISRAEVDRQLRRGVAVHWNPRNVEA